MSKCFCHIRTIKSFSSLSRSYSHNFRLCEVENADASLSHLNYDFIDMHGENYVSECENTLDFFRSEGAIEGKIRKDAVLAFEVILTFSPDATERMKPQIEKWGNKSVEWLKGSFNPPFECAEFIDKETGNTKKLRTTNVISAVVHLDETTPHIHAIVIPIDSRGHLNSTYYTKGRDKLYAIQNSYAEAMKEFGLERGKMFSKASREEICAYYGKLKKAVSAELPFPEPGENVYAYRERANGFYQTMSVHFNQDLQKKETEKNELESDYRYDRHMISKILKTVGLPDLNEYATERISELCSKSIVQEEAIKNYPDKKLSAAVSDTLDDMMSFYRQQLSIQQLPRKKKRTHSEQEKANSECVNISSR